MKRFILFFGIIAFSFGNLLNAQELMRVYDSHTGLYGYKYEDSDKWVVKPQYMHAGDFYNGLACVIKEKGYHKDKHGAILCSKCFAGYIDEKGKIAIPLKFEWANDFSEGLAVVKVWDETSIFYWRFGYIDTKGTLVIPARYDYAEPFRNGQAKVRWYDERGYCWEAYIDQEGRRGEKSQVGNSRLPIGQTKPRW